jgi:hypothetical protein
VRFRAGWNSWAAGLNRSKLPGQPVPLDGTGLVKIEPFSEPQARPLPPSLPAPPALCLG